MNDTTYNGWTNYETWRVNLELIDGVTAQDLTGETLPSIGDLKSALQDYAEGIIESTSSEGIARDYALAFVNAVNWHEIARHLLDDAAENS